MSPTTPSNLVSSGHICPDLPLSISGVEYAASSPVRIAKTLITVFNGFTCPLAIFANTLVFIAVLRKSSLRTVHNTSVLCLALADLLVAMVTQPCFISYQVKMLWVGHVVCSADLAIYAFVELVCTGLSFLTLTLITIERYLAIFHPFMYTEHASRERILGVIGGVWLLWITYASIVRFTPGIDSDYYTVVPCLLISLNFIATVFVYARVVRLTRQNRVGVPPPHNSLPETKTSKTIVYISLALLACFTPVFVVSIMHQAGLLGDHVVYHVMYPAAESAVFLNSLLNPLIYVWRSRCMRSSLKEFWKRDEGVP